MVTRHQAGREAEAGGRMSRLELTRRLVSRLDAGEAIVAGIGNTNFDLAAAAKERPQNFYMMGSMGLATSIALGVALARPERRVFALEGDGSLLMNLGALSTVAFRAPENLTIVVWDNGVYKMTGSQPTATQYGSDLVAAARAAGIEHSQWVRHSEEFEDAVVRALRGPSPALIGARVIAAASASHPDFDTVRLKHRFMEGIGVDDDR